MVRSFFIWCHRAKPVTEENRRFFEGSKANGPGKSRFSEVFLYLNGLMWFDQIWQTESRFLECFSALLTLAFWLWQFGIVWANLKYGVTEQQQRNPQASQQTNPPVEEKHHNGNDRYMDKTVDHCNQNWWRIILYIADCCGDGRGQIPQTMTVKVAHRHILHPVAKCSDETAVNEPELRSGEARIHLWKFQNWFLHGTQWRKISDGSERLHSGGWFASRYRIIPECTNRARRKTSARIDKGGKGRLPLHNCLCDSDEWNSSGVSKWGETARV